MPTLNKRFTLGRLTPPSQRLTVSSADVDAHDLYLLRRALIQTHQGAEVVLQTEHGLWTFVVMGAQLAEPPELFDLQSNGAPQ